MPNELAATIGRLTDLQGRVTEIGNRMHQDALLLVEAQRELSATVSSILRMWMQPMPLPAAPTPPRIVRLAEVSKRVGLCRSSVWRMVKDGRFPPPRRLGTRAVGWRDVEIDEWLRTRKTTQSALRLPARYR